MCYHIKMNILTIADAHGSITPELLEKVIKNRRIDGVFFLGDNRKGDLKTVLEYVPKDIPKVGIVGNHDKVDSLDKYGIPDLHCKTTVLWGYTIGGFRGSIKYPNARTSVLYTNRESEEEIRALESCDILLTHDKPRFKHFFSRNVYNDINHVHSGLTGIGEYIRTYRPKRVYFGHLHRRYILYRGRTRLQCCYGVQVIKLPERK